MIRGDGRVRVSEDLTWVNPALAAMDSGSASDPCGGSHDELGCGGDGELFLDAGAIGFDGFHTAVETFGNLSGADALAQQLKHFELAIAQEFDV